MPILPKTILTVDLGTQSLRVCALTSAGERLWSWSRAVDSQVDGEVFEQHPAQWRSLLESALAEAASAAPRPDVIVATGPLAGWVALDADGEPLTQAVLYPDRRAAPDVARVEQALQEHPASETLGLRVYTPDPLPQWLRLRREQAGLAARTRHFVDATGWLNHCLTGEAVLNHYTALRLYDGALRGALEVGDDVFGRVAALGETIGSLRAGWAERLGWGAVPVVSAPFDSKCAYLAGGLAEEGDGLDISGTVTSIGVRAKQPVRDAERRIYSVPFDGDWLVRGSTASSGGVLEWAREQLLDADFSWMDAAAARAEPGARGLLFLPFHTGERTPLWNPHARGALLGMSLNTDRGDMARAVYEGLAFGARHVLVTMNSCGAGVRSLRLAGGLARNDLLCQIKADVTGLPVLRLADHELTTLGLAVIGSVAAGAWPSHFAAAQAFVQVGTRFAPRPEAVREYAACFERYVAAVQALSPTFIPTTTRAPR